MPAYSFEALTAEGQTRKGVLEADSAKAARSQLRGQAMVPLKVEPLGADGARRADKDGAGQGGGLRRRRVFNATGLGVWTRQIAGLVSSGLPLERALSSLAEEADSPAQQQLVASLRAEVNGGSTFARALAQHPREFSDIFVAVIGAGEQSGNLGLVLERLADDLEEQQALKSKLVGAALYLASGASSYTITQHTSNPITFDGAPITLQRMLGTLLAPLARLVGVPWSEAPAAGALLGTKTVLNEFIAYIDLAHLPPDTLSLRSRMIITYALCGFANFASLGILIGGLATMAPQRRDEVVELGMKSIVAGTLATCMTGAMVGILWSGG